MFMRPIRRQIPSSSRNNARSIRLLKTIAPNASRFGLASLSGFMITRSSVFAVTSFVGLPEGGAYAISLQLISAILQVSQLPAQFAMPRLVNLNIQGAKRAIRHTAIRLSIQFAAMFTLGVLLLAFVAPILFMIIGHNVILLPAPLLFFLGVIMMLEGLHSISAFILMTGNKVPFTRAAVLSAIAVIVGTLFVGWHGWGIWSIIAVQGLVQLSYNNWRWPLMVLQDTRDTAA
jgi:O-antigen/teichoic acid export membrane protein